MEENIIKDYKNVHDNKILSYNVDFINQKLIIETEYYEEEHTKILFDGLLAHYFENVAECNIIFSVEMVSIDWFLDYYKGFLEDHLKHCFPRCNLDNIHKLRDFLTLEKYCIFTISSSLGLEGFVIAKNILIDTKNY